MRKCWLPALGLMICLGGCSVLEAFYRPASGGSQAEKVSKAVGNLPYGWAIQGAIALGGAIFGGGTVHHVHTRKKKKAAAGPNPPAAVA